MSKNKVEVRYFVTCEWCGNGRRGLFCDKSGLGISKDTRHTDEEMAQKLGHFWMILDPKSEPITIEEYRKHRYWKPLAEYNGVFGICTKEKIETKENIHNPGVIGNINQTNS